MQIFEVLLEKAGSGIHHLTLTVEGDGGTAFADFSFAQGEFGFLASEESGLSFCELFAVAVSGEYPGGLVMRTQDQEGESVRGWKIDRSEPQPVTGAEIFDAYCHHPATGEISPPEPGLDYKDAPAICPSTEGH